MFQVKLILLLFLSSMTVLSAATLMSSGRNSNRTYPAQDYSKWTQITPQHYIAYERGKDGYVYQVIYEKTDAEGEYESSDDEGYYESSDESYDPRYEGKMVTRDKPKTEKSDKSNDWMQDMIKMEMLSGSGSDSSITKLFPLMMSNNKDGEEMSPMMWISYLQSMEEDKKGTKGKKKKGMAYKMALANMMGQMGDKSFNEMDPYKMISMMKFFDDDEDAPADENPQVNKPAPPQVAEGAVVAEKPKKNKSFTKLFAMLMNSKDGNQDIHQWLPYMDEDADEDYLNRHYLIKELMGPKYASIYSLFKDDEVAKEFFDNALISKMSEDGFSFDSENDMMSNLMKYKAFKHISGKNGPHPLQLAAMLRGDEDDEMPSQSSVHAVGHDSAMNPRNMMTHKYMPSKVRRVSSRRVSPPTNSRRGDTNYSYRPIRVQRIHDGRQMEQGHQQDEEMDDYMGSTYMQNEE